MYALTRPEKPNFENTSQFFCRVSWLIPILYKQFTGPKQAGEPSQVWDTPGWTPVCGLLWHDSQSLIESNDCKQIVKWNTLFVWNRNVHGRNWDRGESWKAAKNIIEYIP